MKRPVRKEQNMKIKTLKQIAIICFAIGILALLYDGIVSPSYSWRYEKVEKNFHYLHLGMKREEVINLIGYPKNIRQYGSEREEMKEEQWILHFRPFSKLIPVCSFKVNEEFLIKSEMLSQEALD